MPLQPMITGARHMIAAGHYLAAEAGHAVLQAGGNAVDAGVAGGIALDVCTATRCSSPASRRWSSTSRSATRPHHRRARRLAASGAAARRSSSEHGGAIPYGVLRTVVPAAPDAWILALERYGTMSFGDVAAAAIRYAREGFTDASGDGRLHRDDTPTDTGAGPATRQSICPAARAPREGELFVQADLARSMQFMVDEERAASSRGRVAGLHAARDAFYRGDLASAIVRYHQR